MTDTPVSCDRHVSYFHRGASACSRMSSDAVAWRMLHVASLLTGNTLFEIGTQVDGFISKELKQRETVT